MHILIENKQVNPYKATETRQIARELMALSNFIDTYWRYDQHMDNFIAYISKNTDNATLAGTIIF